MGRGDVRLTGVTVCHTSAMAYGDRPSSVLSGVALVCAAGVVLGYGSLLAIVGMLCAAMGMARGEGLAGPAVLVAVVVLVLAFVMPPSIARSTGSSDLPQGRAMTSNLSGASMSASTPNSSK